MKAARLLLTLLSCAILFAMPPARAQSSAHGTLNVQAVVQGSVALVNVDGEWKVIVANAPDRAEILSKDTNRRVPQLRPDEYRSRQIKTQARKPASSIQSAPFISALQLQLKSQQLPPKSCGGW